MTWVLLGVMILILAFGQLLVNPGTLGGIIAFAGLILGSYCIAKIFDPPINIRYRPYDKRALLRRMDNVSTRYEPDSEDNPKDSLRVAESKDDVPPQED